jgi:hypothetical protein
MPVGSLAMLAQLADGGHLIYDLQLRHSASILTRQI